MRWLTRRLRVATLTSLSRFLAGALLAACCLPVWAQGTEGAATPRAEDDTFLLLREAARQGDAARANALASRLPSYAIPSYVDYYRLKPRLAQVQEAEMRAFFARHGGTAIADRLRNDWLLVLGRRRDWVNFDHHYPQFVLQDDLQVRCYHLLSRVARGQDVAGEARALLINPPAYGDACATLVATLHQAGQLGADDLYYQLRLAGELDATGPARRTVALLGGSEKHAAQAVDLPAVALARGAGSTRLDHELYIVALGRMARTSVKLATVSLERNQGKLTPAGREAAWAAIALPASLQHDDDAHEYWRRAGRAPLSREAVQWKARSALRRGDWASLRSTILSMPASLRSDSTWVYWLARAHAASGNRDAATGLYRSIAGTDGFYAQLALEELGQQVAVPPPVAPATVAELAAVEANPGLRRALRFFALGLRTDGAREWNWEVRQMDDRMLLAAAEFARRHNILDRMVHTSDRARAQFDHAHRFPAPHADIVVPATESVGLDRAWVYGLIRQESRFNIDARSSAGASGLMQVMPATGRWVASRIGLQDYVHGRLHDLRTNLVLGTNYLNMIAEKFDGSQVLATAAYNAGPGRIRGWRAKMSAPLEGAVFAETIPFAETRGYVKNVMANATNYAAMFENRPQSLKARLGTIDTGEQRNELP